MPAFPTSSRGAPKAIGASVALWLALAGGAAGATEPAGGTTDALAVSAEVLAQEGRVDEALLLYRKVYEADPEPVLLFNIAVLLERKGDLHGAYEAFERYVAAETEPEAKKKGAYRADLVRRVLPPRWIVRPTPADAWVMLDGQPVQPGAPLDVERGRHVVEVSARGYEPRSLEAEAVDGPVREIALPLKPLASALVVISQVRGGVVRVDGEEVGVTPLGGPIPVAPGSHDVQILMNGVERFFKTVELKPDEKLTLVPELGPPAPVPNAP